MEIFVFVSQSGVAVATDGGAFFVIEQWWADFNAWALGLKQTYDPIIWLFSSAVTLVPGSFVIYKWWNYRNSRLPQRLEELLKRDESRLREARSALAKAIIKPAPISSPVTHPLFVVPTMTMVLKRLNWSRWWRPMSFAVTEPELELALAEIEGKLQFCAKKEALHREQEAAAYLLKGAVGVAKASKFDTNSAEREQNNRVALNHFNRALEINPNDAEALEYVAHQHRVLQQFELAQAAYERLTGMATGSSVEARATRSRAHRYAGEMLEKKYDRTGIPASLQRAREHLDLLDGALDCLPMEERNSLDHAAIHEVAGRVTEKMDKALLPADHYGKALAIYSEIGRREPANQDAVAGNNRMNKALAAFHADDAPMAVQ